MSVNLDAFVSMLKREVPAYYRVRVDADNMVGVYDGDNLIVLAEFVSIWGVEFTTTSEGAVGLPIMTVSGLGWSGAVLAIRAWVDFNSWTRCTGVETRVIAD